MDWSEKDARSNFGSPCCPSSEGRELLLSASAFASLSLSSSEFSSSERVLSAGLGNAGGMLNEMRAPSQCVND